MQSKKAQELHKGREEWCRIQKIHNNKSPIDNVLVTSSLVLMKLRSLVSKILLILKQSLVAFDLDASVGCKTVKSPFSQPFHIADK